MKQKIPKLSIWYVFKLLHSEVGEGTVRHSIPSVLEVKPTLV